jgi:hypothetical protein
LKAKICIDQTNTTALPSYSHDQPHLKGSVCNLGLKGFLFLRLHIFATSLVKPPLLRVFNCSR